MVDFITNIPNLKDDERRAWERREILVYQTRNNPNYECIYSYNLSIVEPELTETRDNRAHNHGFSCSSNNILETR